MNVETFVYAFIFGVVIWLFARRFGLRPSPWREAIATTLLYVGIWLALKASGFGGTETVTVAFLAAMVLVWAWKRLSRRTGTPTGPERICPSGGGCQRG